MVCCRPSVPDSQLIYLLLASCSLLAAAGCWLLLLLLAVAHSQIGIGDRARARARARACVCARYPLAIDRIQLLHVSQPLGARPANHIHNKLTFCGPSALSEAQRTRARPFIYVSHITGALRGARESVRYCHAMSNTGQPLIVVAAPHQVFHLHGEQRRQRERERELLLLLRQFWSWAEG